MRTPSGLEITHTTAGVAEGHDGDNGDERPTMEPTCKAALNIAGEHFQCDIPVTEDGTHGPFAHGNTEAKAIWCSHDESVHAS